MRRRSRAQSSVGAGPGPGSQSPQHPARRNTEERETGRADQSRELVPPPSPPRGSHGQAPGQGGTDRDWHVPPPGAVTGDAAAAGPAGPARLGRPEEPICKNTSVQTRGWAQGCHSTECVAGLKNSSRRGNKGNEQRAGRVCPPKFRWKDASRKGTKSKDRGPRGPDRGLDLTSTGRLFPTAASSVAAPWPPLPPLRYRTRLFGWLRERISIRTMPQVPPPSCRVASSLRLVRDPRNGGPRWADLWTCRHSPPTRGRG